MKIYQCWDDGVEDDIRLIEILRRYGAKASFNLNPDLHEETRRGWFDPGRCKQINRLSLSELPSVYEGFTIANHTSTHPWPSRVTLDVWQREVVDGRKALQDTFQQEVLGFAYPFGEHNAARERTVAEAGHVYARVVASINPCWPVEDPMRFQPTCHFRSDAFWPRYTQAKLSGAGVFYFWGHSYELVTAEDWRQFEQTISRITRDVDTAWGDLPELFVG